ELIFPSLMIFMSTMIGGLVARASTFSSNFCFLDLLDSSSSPALLELPYALVSLPSITSLSIGTNEFIQLMPLPLLPSNHSIFAYEKLKSFTNQSLNRVLNAFEFPPIRAAFSYKIRMPGVDWSDKVDQEIRFKG
nr:hypothetical protein [Tanacetum cinerariifolium]